MGKSKKQTLEVRKTRMCKARPRKFQTKAGLEYELPLILDITTHENHGIFALIEAIRSNSIDYVNKVLPTIVNINASYISFYGTYPRIYYGTYLHIAAEAGNYKIFKLLIKYSADIHKRNYISQETILHRAILSSNYKIIKYLVKHGVDVNVPLTKSDKNSAETALHMAARSGTEKIVRLLLENGAHVNAKSEIGVTPLVEAIRARNHDIRHALRDYGADIDYTYQENGRTKMIWHDAIESGNWTALDSWLYETEEMDLVFTNNNYFCRFVDHRMLHYTSEIDHMDNMVVYLLEVGFNVNTLDSDNRLLIDSAVALEYDPNYILIIKKHIVKLIAAGFPVCQKNIKAVEGKFDNYLAECRMEIEKMKNIMIEGSNLTFMDVLHKNYHYLALYLNNVDLEKLVFCGPLSLPEFPIYGSMMYHRFCKVDIRISCLRDSSKILYDIFYELQLPDTFVRELFFHLPNNALTACRISVS